MAGGHGAHTQDHGALTWTMALCPLPKCDVSGPRHRDNEDLSFASIFNAVEQILQLLPGPRAPPAVSQIIHGRGQVAVPVGRQEPCHRGTQPRPPGDRGLPWYGVLGP